MRPNKAAVTPIGQQNPTMTPKTVGFAREKKAKIPILILLKKTDFLFLKMHILCTRARAGAT